MHAGQLGGTPASLSGNQLIAIAYRAQHYWLDQALGLDRICQFLQSLGANMDTGLVFTTLDFFYGYIA